ncbi:hypothetical protein ES703_75026 [subsurface metagenome]
MSSLRKAASGGSCPIICSSTSSDIITDRSSLSTSALTNSGLSRVLFRVKAMPKTARDRKRRKLKRLSNRPLRTFIVLPSPVFVAIFYHTKRQITLIAADSALNSR